MNRVLCSFVRRFGVSAIRQPKPRIRRSITNLRPEAAAKTADSGAGKQGKKGKKKDGGGGGLYPFLDKKDKDGNYRLSNERLSRLVFPALRDGDKKWFSAFKTKARISEAFMSIGPAIYLLFSLVSRDY